MLTTTVNGFLHDYYAQIAQAGGIRPVLVALVNSLMGESVQFRNFDELISVGLPKLLPSKEENGAVYYDYSQSGMVIDTTGSSFEDVYKRQLLRRAKIAASKKLTVGSLTLDAEEHTA